VSFGTFRHASTCYEDRFAFPPAISMSSTSARLLARRRDRHFPTRFFVTFVLVDGK
jgi:hypothetical protein